MSVAEIQDNKWEVSAAKTPIGTPGSIGLLIMMSGFTLFFVAILIGSVIGTFTDTKEMNFDKKQQIDKPAAKAE